MATWIIWNQFIEFLESQIDLLKALLDAVLHILEFNWTILWDLRDCALDLSEIVYSLGQIACVQFFYVLFNWLLNLFSIIHVIFDLLMLFFHQFNQCNFFLVELSHSSCDVFFKSLLRCLNFFQTAVGNKIIDEDLELGLTAIFGLLQFGGKGTERAEWMRAGSRVLTRVWWLKDQLVNRAE